jgi:hypothetical protein
MLRGVKGGSTMNNVNRWVAIVATLVLVAVAGTVAYNAGIAHGIEQSGKLVAPAAGPNGYPYPYPYHGWHRPWGFGFFLFPLFFFGFWFVVVRGLFWRRGYGYPRGGGGCGPDGRLDEWHRRAHERLNDPLPGAPAER